MPLPFLGSLHTQQQRHITSFDTYTRTSSTAYPAVKDFKEVASTTGVEVQHPHANWLRLRLQTSGEYGHE